ncbi:hypothetical protein [Reyranella sp.]|uniref:hypothetical protein n=1 Tax=Reyranella sp. TaxID=1929291 RepID=UPI002607EB31|nr:hypothetical protein [Reyranella sp.]HQS18093.1 hypothetical protein [Reyranella sp.]HQT14668.1 hypothetical protein [Reyranella sp.]
MNEGGRSAVMPFSRIRGVRLFCEESERSNYISRGDISTIFFCELRLSDRQTILLSSNMAGRYLYRDFVQLLHQRLVPIRRRIRFRGGLKCLDFIGWVLLGIWSSSFQFNSYIVPLFPLLSEERLAFRQNRPRRYRPDRVPNFLLPDVGTVTPA